jgi:hypothetical protein
MIWGKGAFIINKPLLAPEFTGDSWRGGVNQLHGEDIMGTEEISPKSRLVALLLCLFLAPLGIHRFYVGKVGTGVLMIFTLGGLGIWAFIDLIMIIVGSFKDKEGRRVFRWTEPGST